MWCSAEPISRSGHSDTLDSILVKKQIALSVIGLAATIFAASNRDWRPATVRTAEITNNTYVPPAGVPLTYLGLGSIVVRKHTWVYWIKTDKQYYLTESKSSLDVDIDRPTQVAPDGGNLYLLDLKNREHKLIILKQIGNDESKPAQAVANADLSPAMAESSRPSLAVAPNVDPSPAMAPSAKPVETTEAPTPLNQPQPSPAAAVTPPEVYRVGAGISAPVVIFKTDPGYSEEARNACLSGAVKLYLEVDETGHATNMRILKGLGHGLDEQAIDAVTKWRFKPGMKDGKPVVVAAQSK
jgi:TonB family protein